MSYRGHDNRHQSLYVAAKSLTVDMTFDVILDLGARHGEGIDYFGIHHPEATYIMVEPKPSCCARIRKKIEETPDIDARLIEGLLGPKAGKERLIVFDRDNDQSSNLFSDRGGAVGNASYIDVDVVSFSVLDEYAVIDFAKVNIEGAEYELIQDPFFDRVQMFVMEAHNNMRPGKNWRTIIDALQDRYDLWTFGNNNHRYSFIYGVRG